MTGLSFVSRSATGSVRKDNQDNVLCLEAAGLFVVADGMGGGAAGALASRMVCEGLEPCGKAGGYLLRLEAIGQAVNAANARIFAYARDQGYTQMGSTVALLALDRTSGTRAAIGYIGDSRVYRVRDGKTEALTRDHSVGAELEARVGAAAGAKFALRSNPLAHVLTRAIGTEPDVALDWRKVDCAAGDRFVICSDGVHDVIEPAEIGTLSSGDLPQAADRLEREILKRGAPDNYSFVIVETGGRS